MTAHLLRAVDRDRQTIVAAGRWRAPSISASATAERTAFRILSRVSLAESSFTVAIVPLASSTRSVVPASRSTTVTGTWPAARVPVREQSSSALWIISLRYNLDHAHDQRPSAGSTGETGLPGVRRRVRRNASVSRDSLSVIVVSSGAGGAKVVERLKNGEDFAALAREISTDPTANQGGYMGKLDPAKLRPELQEALQGVGQGQRSAIARMPGGYAILKVLADAPNLNPQDAQPNRLQALTGAGAVCPTLDLPVSPKPFSPFPVFPSRTDGITICTRRARFAGRPLYQLSISRKPIWPGRPSRLR